MLDLSDAAFRAQLIESGTYDGCVFKVRVINKEAVFLVFTWKLDVPDRNVHGYLEDFTCI